MKNYPTAPIPPPNRTYSDTLFGLVETEESKRRTEEWRPNTQQTTQGNMMNAYEITGLLNELLELDRPAIAALVANRVPCNKELAHHEYVRVGVQNDGYTLGLLGILTGLCDGVTIVPRFEIDPNNIDGFKRLTSFEVVE